MAETAYIVLRRDDKEGAQIGDMLKWTVVGRSEANNAEAAIREIAAGLIEGSSGYFVATPARSWKPVTVQAVQTTVLKLDSGQAGE